MLAQIIGWGAEAGPIGWTLVALAFFALCAGFVDAVAGGGGLIQVPALFSALPQASVASLFGTNKFAAIAGTLMAAKRYVQAVQLPWPVLWPALVGAAIFSWLGAAAVSFLERQWAQPVVLLLLVWVAVMTLKKREMGAVHAPKIVGKSQTLWGFLLGAGIGFYDGFFGPGTGTFLIFLFVRGFGYDFLHASASSKLVNAMTNFAALAFFIPAGEIFVLAGLVMAVCNMAGAWLGAQVAVRKGSRFVRQFFLVLLTVLIAKMAVSTWEMFS